MNKILKTNVIKKQWKPSDISRNEVFIQMIHEKFRKQLFGDIQAGPVAPDKLLRVKKGLANHGLWKIGKTKTTKKETSLVSKHQDEPAYPPEPVEPIYFKLPPFEGSNIAEHFYNIAEKFARPYKSLGNKFERSMLPEMPSTWNFTPGWSRYRKDENNMTIAEIVDYPGEDALFFDVEVCVNDCAGRQPTMATCASVDYWYSWCSPRLVYGKSETKSSFEDVFSQQPKITINDLIPFGRFDHRERLIIGHNVSYDRSFIKEQHETKSDMTRFLDTMSLHISVSGLTGYQRALSFSYKVGEKNGLSNLELKDKFELSGHPDPGHWSEDGTLNNLKDVYAFYCKQEMTKEARDIFVKGTMQDVRNNFQDLLTYCAKDCDVTHQVFKELWKMYLERFPHPVTLAGTLEMSVMYLPVNIPNWERYLEEAQNTYDDLEREISQSLRTIANRACLKLLDNSYKKDPWLWDLDWTTEQLRYYKPKPLKKNEKAEEKKETEFVKLNEIVEKEFPDSDGKPTENVKNLIESFKKTGKVQPCLAGYPAWYRDFCDRPFGGSKLHDDTRLQLWEPGPFKISTQVRATPKLLKLLWRGYPLHFDSTHKWGFLVPRSDSAYQDHGDFPYDEYMKVIEGFFKEDELRDIINSEEEINEEFFGQSNENTDKTAKPIDLYGLNFFRLPHRGGIENKVGNPLGKEFVRYMEDGTLTSCLDINEAHSVIRIGKTLSYWKNANKRIYSQQVIATDESGIKGALLPRVVVAGTITRRATEPTWLTASNAVKDRLGSELKAMVQVPKGYKFVGADVDSQELWIASLIGDSHFARIHGCTPVGWMTLQGNKADKTDMHSKVAEIVGINRDQAKILNYGRIYGAGKAFASRFLEQSNEDLDSKEAKKKANTIYKQTKGSKVTMVDREGKFLKKVWHGGSESHMFNKLEEIALSDEPETPVLGCKISKALLSSEVRQLFLPSVINWVVQSSAVDYLHLMLVSMKWLMNLYQIEGRFCISIHDEVRYMIKEEHRYKAALALQITNLLTRSMFAYKLKMYDLPQSVAFFSAVDIDTVLRKEVYLDCKTPSNPYGLKMAYNIERGESISMQQLLEIPEVQELAFFKEEDESDEDGGNGSYFLSVFSTDQTQSLNT